MEFLNDSQQKSLEGYKLIKWGETKLRVDKKDYIKYMLAENYTFYEGGFVINIDNPRITIMRWSDRKKQTVDINKQYVFYKKNMAGMTKRTFFQNLLENLKNRTVNLIKID